MENKKKLTFCTECRKDTEYILKKKYIQQVIRGIEYHFQITVAVCAECGEEINIDGLIDKNIYEVDKQYRMAEDIVSIEDIKKLMNIYKIGKAPLSLVLGFGEITITRYLDGQVPSKEYSDIIRKALSSPTYMKKMLNVNRPKIANAAYNKAMTATNQLEELFSISEKMLKAIDYVFKQLEEVTPLMLQKILYFIQGIYFALYDRPMFIEDCEAWIHGPVYPKVYNLFRDFKYNPIEDDRFSVLDKSADKLTLDERKVIDLVVNTFGLYGGKVLEKITHSEEPWRLARRGYEDSIPSHEIIKKENIQSYYKAINSKYNLASEEGIKKYIHKILGNNFL